MTAVSGCAASRAASASPSPTASPIDVLAAVATRGVLRPAPSIPGAVAPYETVALSNGITEPATSVEVQEGDRVRRGQVLARLAVDDLQANLRSAQATAGADRSRVEEAGLNAQLSFAQGPQQVRTAQATLAQAQATLQEAQLNLSRDRRLVAQGYLPQQNLDEQAVVVRNDRQAVTAARSTLAQAFATIRATGDPEHGLQASTIGAARQDEAAQLASAEQLRRQISRATIVSPVDGIVINRNLNPGEYPAGRQIFTIEASSTVFAILTASAVQVYQIATGDDVTIARSGIPNGVFYGRVVTVLDAATPGSTNFTVKVAVPHPRHALRPGTPVSASIALRPLHGVLVPASAFVDDTRTRIITIEAGKAKTRHVVEQSTDGANSIVTGLPAGTAILRSGGTSVEDGEPVRVVR